MGSFGIVAAAGLGVFVLGVLLLGYYYPGSGADVLDWRPTRSIELEAELELDDVQQMLAAQNERRRRRGAPERSLADVERQVAGDLAEQRARAAAHRAHASTGEDERADLEAMLAAANARRARRGEDPIDLDQYRAGVLGSHPRRER